MFDIIKQQINLLKVLEEDLSVTFRQVGDKNWVIDGGKDEEACPFCNHHDCFRVHFEEGNNSSAFYKCFSCGEYGDVISWKVKESKLKPGEAARELAKKYDIKLPNDYNPVQQVFNLAADYYHNCLIDTCNKPFAVLNGLTPLRYQLEIRKRKLDALTKFKVGYSDGNLIEYLLSLNIDESIIEKSGLRNKSGKDFLPANCFIYPHFVRGKASHFTFKDPLKRIHYQLPKKYSLNNHLFYGQDTILNMASIALVEGENDFLSVYEAGGHSTMAIIGQISNEQLEWLKDNCQEKAILTIFDPDEAGDKYREKVEVLRRHFKNLVHILPPEEKDIDEHLSNGASFTELLKNKVTVTLKVPEKRTLPIMPWEEAVLRGPNGILSTPVPAPLENLPNALLEPLPRMPEGMSLVGPAIEIGKYEPPAIPTDFSGDLSDETPVSDIVQIPGSSVVMMNNCYYRVVHKDGISDYVRISDFKLVLKNIILYEDTGERRREIIIQRQNGYKTEVFEVDSETKVSIKAFKKLMAEKADAEWLGRENDLDAMWRLVYSLYPEVTVRLVQQVGRHERLKCWIFKNVLITDSGNEIKPDDNGVFWISGNTNGIKLKSARESEEFDGIPSLCMDLSREQADALLKETLIGLTRILKNPGLTLLSLGWIHANIYSNAIHRADGGFGILMLWGTGGKGKSTIAGWLQNFFGLNDKVASTSVQQLKRAIGFQRIGAYYASLPLLLDELRADEESNQHLAMIRSWYDRTGRVVAEKEKNMVRDVPVRATLLLAGEDLPADPATRERCVMLRVPPMTDAERDSLQGNYATLVENSRQFSNITYYWLKDSSTEDIKSVISGIRDLDKSLVNAGCSNRISKVWASAGYFGQKLCDKYFPEFDFHNFLVEMCRSEQSQQKGDTTLNQFFADMASIHARANSRITDNHVFRDGDKVHIWYPATYKEISDDNKARERNWSKNAILRSIKEEPYFISDDVKRGMGISNVRRVVLTLDLKRAPEALQAMVGYEPMEEVKV